MSSEKIRLALVDDHQIVIEGIMALLKGHPTVEIVIATTQPEDVPGLLKTNAADILLTDIMMPGLPGNELAKIVKKQFPGIRIVALSMNGEGSLVNEMINNADIAGYILKNTGKQELVTALEKVAAGGIYFSDEVIRELEQDSHRRKQADEINLTDREMDVLRLIEKEYNNKQIAEALFISERTVETHRKNIFRKTGTNTVLGLIKFAYERRLI